MPIKVELLDFYHSGNHDYIGEATFTINELRKNQINKVKFIDKRIKKDVGTLNFQKVSRH
jgi:hypothetical protein